MGKKRTVAALVHSQCGHVLGVCATREELRAQSAMFGVTDPVWVPRDLTIGEAVDRLLAGSCRVCLIEPAP